MEGAGRGFRKDLVNKLLHAHFTDGKTKVGGDALRLMAELLTVFVVGEPGLPADQSRHGLLVFSWGGSPPRLSHPPSKAAVRSVRQAQAEDLALVDVAQLEKVLPQLLLDF
ncbi:centromere protein X isoform X3 [Meles meles]|uniref:centromere protein X isoform X3 n=1 Tax=Meles meles TaxID=9662 RepID=UPI001E69DC5D|nr:centromere protein X isoform X3 [Meles meles]